MVGNRRRLDRDLNHGSRHGWKLTSLLQHVEWDLNLGVQQGLVIDATVTTPQFRDLNRWSTNGWHLIDFTPLLYNTSISKSQSRDRNGWAKLIPLLQHLDQDLNGRSKMVVATFPGLILFQHLNQDLNSASSEVRPSIWKREEKAPRM
ncbi:unnamed protein product [Sphagnum troendelagicum]|uniref:Uncharacterized protein n=1 Tax=Sphagnum troendelagicum TaxID=128251 RepID=A0ABP0UAD5_9BRYO